MTSLNPAQTPAPSADRIRNNGPRFAEPARRVNVGGSERTISVVSGALLAALGLSRRSLPGLLVTGLGGMLMYRGATGVCPVYGALGIDAAHEDVGPEDYFERGIQVAQSCLINKSPRELYAYWRNLENLPRIMRHLESVRVIDGKRSHWVARAPRFAGGSVEWDAEIINDEPNSLIAWQSLPGAEVHNAGSVGFLPATIGRGGSRSPERTMVAVVIDYLPPAGRLGKWVARLFGEEPQQQIQEDLRNFKRSMETSSAT